MNLDILKQHFESDPIKFMGWTQDQIWNDYLDNQVDPLSTLIKQFNEKKIDFIVVGSMALKLHGLIDRNPSDIDVITFDSYYLIDAWDSSRLKSSSYIRRPLGESGSFKLGDNVVYCFGLSYENSKIDVFHNSGGTPNFITMIYKGHEVKVEVVESIIKAKRAYIESASQIDNNFINLDKHKDDITRIYYKLFQ